MCPESVIRRLAGVMILLSLGLGTWVSPWWYLLSALVGINLLQSTFTGWCLPERLLARVGLFGCAGGGEGTGSA